MNCVEVVVAVMMLCSLTCVADRRVDLVGILRGNPYADFSRAADQRNVDYWSLLADLAEADATCYFEDSKDIDRSLIGYIGKKHAFRHHLIGVYADNYTDCFTLALDKLLTKG
jgi:hypothetical protein